MGWKSPWIKPPFWENIFFGYFFQASSVKLNPSQALGTTGHNTKKKSIDTLETGGSSCSWIVWLVHWSGDLTRVWGPQKGSVLVSGHLLISGKSRLVKYYSIWPDWWIFWRSCALEYESILEVSIGKNGFKEGRAAMGVVRSFCFWEMVETILSIFPSSTWPPLVK